MQLHTIYNIPYAIYNITFNISHNDMLHITYNIKYDTNIISRIPWFLSAHGAFLPACVAPENDVPVASGVVDHLVFAGPTTAGYKWNHGHLTFSGQKNQNIKPLKPGIAEISLDCSRFSEKKVKFSKVPNKKKLMLNP